jgi:hypothetical protein
MEAPNKRMHVSGNQRGPRTNLDLHSLRLMTVRRKAILHDPSSRRNVKLGNKQLQADSLQRATRLVFYLRFLCVVVKSLVVLENFFSYLFSYYVPIGLVLYVVEI